MIIVLASALLVAAGLRLALSDETLRGQLRTLVKGPPPPNRTGTGMCCARSIPTTT